MRSLTLFALAIFTAASALPATYTVNDLGDAGDALPGDDICATAGAVCTLRAAIQEANAHAGADSISFSVAGTTAPATPLPAVTERLTIQGDTAPGYSGSPLFLIDGGGSVGGGLTFATGSALSLIDAIQVLGFTSAGITIHSNNVSLQRSFIGPVGGGLPNVDGIRVVGAPAVVGGVIGGPSGAENVIDGNSANGIVLDGASNVTIAGNYIGADAPGFPGAGNLGDGVVIVNGSNNTIGAADRQTAISRNGGNGVTIVAGSGNLIISSLIGDQSDGPGNGGSGIDVTASGNTIGSSGAGNVIAANAFDGVSISGSGVSNVVVQANTIMNHEGSGVFAGGVSNLTIGGTSAALGNVIVGNFSGVEFDGGTASSVAGNRIGLLGDDSPAPNGFGIVLNDSTNISVGATGGGANIISGNALDGLGVYGGSGIVIENNRIGTDGAGSAAQGNGGAGIYITSSDGAIVRSNVVSGNGFHGIEIDTSTGVTVHSNVAGLSADQLTSIGNGGDGVNVCSSASGTVVGSVALGGNVIAGNSGSGIGVEPTALENNTFAANSIFNNGSLGIDLNVDLVTSNDPLDPDLGPNALQNFPTLTWAVANSTQTFVQGSLNSTPSMPFALHFYASPAADPSGFGEGQAYLGTTNVTTGAGGDAPFSFAASSAVPAGHVITATATGPSGTSEFSATHSVGPAPTVQFSLATYSIVESGGSATITVTRSGDLTGTSRVNYATSNGTAMAPGDYTATGGTLVFGPGISSQTFSVAIVDETSDEPDETINLTLSLPDAAALGVPSAAVLTIQDGDPPPSLSINNVTMNEGNAGTTPFVFTVTLSSATGFTVTVDYATADGTAAAGTDYNAASGTLTFAPGALTQTITVNAISDSAVETDETFFVNLANPANATISVAQGTGTITNDDVAPTAADLSIAKTLTITGSTTTYTIVVVNAGPGTATGVTVTDPLQGSQLVSANSTAGACSGTSTVTCAVGTLANGASATITIVVAAQQSPVNTATVSANEPDPDPANNTATAVFPIPTLSVWILLALAAVLGTIALTRLRI